MSENLDLVKSILACWERGDFTSSDWADPEIEFAMVGPLIDGQWQGIAAMSEAWAEVMRAYEGLRSVPDGFQEIGQGRVLVFLRNVGRGKGSGIDVREIAAKSANLFEVQDGRVTRLTIYWDRRDALADAGLPTDTAQLDS